MLIRLQELVPPVYVRESRDFQLLCRLVDAWANSSKLDADLMPFTMDTKNARNNTLNLLQTKVGFFTKYQLTDIMMRYFLCVFPEAIKWKGTLKGITYAVNAFIKALNINDKVIIGLDTENEFNIVIKTSVRIDNIDKLEEFLSYIIPTGYTYEFQFYTELPEIETGVEYMSSGSIIIADNKTNASIRYDYNKFDTDSEDAGIVPVWEKEDFLPITKEPLRWYTEYFTYYEKTGSTYTNIPKGTAPDFYATPRVIYYEYNETKKLFEVLLTQPVDWEEFFYNYYYFDATAVAYKHVGHDNHVFIPNKYYKAEKALWDMTVTNVGLAGLSGMHDIYDSEGNPERILQGVLIGETI